MDIKVRHAAIIEVGFGLFGLFGGGHLYLGHPLKAAMFFFGYWLLVAAEIVAMLLISSLTRILTMQSLTYLPLFALMTIPIFIIYMILSVKSLSLEKKDDSNVFDLSKSEYTFH